MKPGEQYGTGIAAVIKSGQLAMECGFSVSVKEIPCGEGNTKNDPDSYCTSRTKFKDLEEVDYITWYAGYAFKADGTTEDKSAAVTRIAKMVAMVGDEVKEQISGAAEENLQSQEPLDYGHQPGEKKDLRIQGR